MMAAPEPPDCPADDEPRDLSSLDDIEERLARYRRAGDVLAAATRYRRELRWEILRALASAREGVTRDWRLRTVKRHQSGYTVAECERTFLFVEPVGDEGAPDEPAAS